MVRTNSGVVGWCDGPGLTSSAGESYNLDESRARAYCAWLVVLGLTALNGPLRQYFSLYRAVSQREGE